MEKPVHSDSPTIRLHKRQFFWQILLPFLLMAGLITAAAVLVASGEAAQTRVWADVSMVWVLAPLLILALAVIIVLVFIIYGFARLMPLIPRLTGRAQQITSTIAAGTRKTTDGMVKPLLWVRQAGTIVKSLFNQL